MPNSQVEKLNMRDIRFRAWVSQRAEMRFVTRIDFAWKNISLDLRSGQRRRFEWHEVELMQYTGLHDKNGKEIYEGDIVRYHYYDKPENSIEDEVIFDFGMFGVEGCAINLSHVYIVKTLEVIGNIYENPELLK